MIANKRDLLIVTGDHGGYAEGFCAICKESGWLDDIRHKDGCPVDGDSKTIDVRPFVPGIVVESATDFYTGTSDLFIQMLRAGEISEEEFDQYVRTIKDRALGEHDRTVELFQNNAYFNRVVMSITDTVRTRMLKLEHLGCLFRAILDQFDPH